MTVEILFVRLLNRLISVETDDTVHHPHVPVKTPDDTQQSTFSDEYLLTFVLPAVVIILMILIAAIIACCLHRRRMTGKMELGKSIEREYGNTKSMMMFFHIHFQVMKKNAGRSDRKEFQSSSKMN